MTLLFVPFIYLYEAKQSSAIMTTDRIEDAVARLIIWETVNTPSKKERIQCFAVHYRSNPLFFKTFLKSANMLHYKAK